jgi:chemotaxis protein MotB
MGRQKKAPDPPAGVPAWMATFSDLVTLLLTFFVMLMAMASFEKSEPIDAMFDSIREALGDSGFGDGLLSAVFGEQLSSNNRRDVATKPIEPTPSPASPDDMSEAAIRLTRDPSEVRLTLQPDVFFASGSATLVEGARSRLRPYAQAVRQEDVGVRIEGHTDVEGDESANWSLSSLRALTVAQVFSAEGVPADRIQARGYGPFRPISLHPDDRARNRRIEVVLTGTDIQTQEAWSALVAAGVAVE